MLSSHFPTTILFFCFETATALFHFGSTGNALSLGQGRGKITLEKKQPPSLLAEGCERGWHSLLSIWNFHPFLFFSTSWGCGAIASLGGPRSGLSYSCSLVFVSLDQGTLTLYLKPDHKRNLNSKSNSVLRLES